MGDFQEKNKVFKGAGGNLWGGSLSPKRDLVWPMLKGYGCQ